MQCPRLGFFSPQEEEALWVGLDHKKLKDWLQRHYHTPDTYYMLLDTWRRGSPK